VKKNLNPLTKTPAQAVILNLAGSPAKRRRTDSRNQTPQVCRPWPITPEINGSGNRTIPGQPVNSLPVKPSAGVYQSDSRRLADLKTKMRI
jgi:hypothetical protein